jgi:hypothetical protein
VSDWIPQLASAILEDRVDRGCTPEDALRRAEAYAAWLERLTSNPHDRATCPDEPAIRRWRGDIGYHTGQATVIVAKQGAGKSNAASLLIERALMHRPEWDIYSNLPFPWNSGLRNIVPSPANLYSVRSMSELLRGICERTIPAGRIPAVCVDEMDQTATSHSWANSADESWTKFLFVERHFRVRGPILVYHVWEHVPLPLRRLGALRGSYFRVIVKGGLRRLACIEDTSRWFSVSETKLPYYNLGLRGFALDVDMEPLEASLDGSLQEMAAQTVAYLDQWQEAREDERQEELLQARERHLQSMASTHRAVSEQQFSSIRRREEIIAAFVENPDLTNREAKERFRTSAKYLVELRHIALERIAARPTPSVPSPQEA